jgi:hypothetical protein
MEASSKIHGPVALSPGKEPLLPIGEKTGCPPLPGIKFRFLGRSACSLDQCFSTAGPRPPDPRLIKKNLPGRGLTKVQNYWPRCYADWAIQAPKIYSITDNVSLTFISWFVYFILYNHSSLQGLAAHRSRTSDAVKLCYGYERWLYRSYSQNTSFMYTFGMGLLLQKTSKCRFMIIFEYHFLLLCDGCIP